MATLSAELGLTKQPNAGCGPPSHSNKTGRGNDTSSCVRPGSLGTPFAMLGVWLDERTTIQKRSLYHVAMGRCFSDHRVDRRRDGFLPRLRRGHTDFVDSLCG